MYLVRKLLPKIYLSWTSVVRISDVTNAGIRLVSQQRITMIHRHQIMWYILCWLDLGNAMTFAVIIGPPPKQELERKLKCGFWDLYTPARNPARDSKRLGMAVEDVDIDPCQETRFAYLKPFESSTLCSHFNLFGFLHHELRALYKIAAPTQASGHGSFPAAASDWNWTE